MPSATKELQQPRLLIWPLAFRWDHQQESKWVFWVLVHCYEQHRQERGRKKKIQTAASPWELCKKRGTQCAFPPAKVPAWLRNLSYHTRTLSWGLPGSLVTSKSSESWHGKDPTILPRLAGRASCLGKASMLQLLLPALSEFTDWKAVGVHSWLCLGSLGMNMGSTTHVMWLMLVSGLVLKFKHMFISCLSLSPPFFPNLTFTTWQENGSLQTQARAWPNIHRQHASINRPLAIHWDKLRYNTGQGTSWNSLFLSYSIFFWKPTNLYLKLSSHRNWLQSFVKFTFFVKLRCFIWS